MKKVLALALALCMVFAMGTVAFAATVQTNDPNNHDANPETVLIETTYTGDLENYTVTIPADLDLPWTTSASSLTASVKGQIMAGHKVTLSVEMPEALTLDGVTATLAIAATNLTTDVSDAEIIAGKDLATSFTIDGYAEAPIGTYSGVATYSVVYA